MGGKSRAELTQAAVDQSWMRHARCKVCGVRYCVNNYDDRKVRVRRVRGVAVCPWCWARPLLVDRYVIVRDLAKLHEAKNKRLEVIRLANDARVAMEET